MTTGELTTLLDGQRPSKRQRRADVEPDGYPCRSSQYWFSDGNIIIQAENTQFRVHRGVLAVHSTVFKDTFDLPQPPGEPSVDGCPLISVHETAQDWTWFLTYMYRPDRVNPNSIQLEPGSLYAMLNLGRKYQCDVIYDGFLAHLRQRLPESLFFWDFEYSRPASIRHFHESLYALINFAVQADIADVLPLAYYIAACGDIKNIIHGFPAKSPTRPAISLCGEAQSAVLIGRDRLRAKVLSIYNWVSAPTKEDADTYTHTLGPVPSPKCTARSCCRSKYQLIAKRIVSSIVDDLKFGLRPVNVRTSTLYSGLCGPCCASIESSLRAGRTTLWNSLPTLFGLVSKTSDDVGLVLVSDDDSE